MTDQSNDFQLIRQYLEDQDETALRTLLDRYSQLGFSVIYRLVPDQDEAEDVLQDALIKVIHGLKQFKMESSFKTWFCKICYHEGINHYKKFKHRTPLQLQDFEYELRDHTSLHSEVEKRLEKQLIWKCVHELDEKYKTVLLAFYHDELSIQEISDMMKLNENTVKTHLSRGKTLLKEKLSQHQFA